jgi:hypothetical protein
MYNGYPMEEVTDEGAGKNGILNYKNGIITRGALMDIARLKAWIVWNPAQPSTRRIWTPGKGKPTSRLDRAAWFSSERAVGHAGTPRDPGVSGKPAWRDCTPPARVGLRRAMSRYWAATERRRSSGVDGVPQPIHELVIVSMGMPIFDNCDLELIGREANRRQRSEFLVTAAPAAVPKATASVLNPIATF